MQRLLDGLSPEGEALLDLIPGGVMQCKNDGQYTIVGVNEGFLSMFGFTREELASQFQNQFLALIHPSDRQNFLLEIGRQLNKGDRLSLSYRVLCKDGGYKWTASSAKLFGDGREERFFCIFLDLTEVRDAQEKLRLSLEHLEIIMNQSSDIIFEWDFAADTISFSPNWLEKFGYAPHYDGSLPKRELLRHFHPDDVDPMAELLEETKKGVPNSVLDVRICNAKEQYIWCRIRAATQYSADKTPLRAVGTISDIDEEKRMMEDLRRRAELDALTGLYNHTEIQRRAESYLAGAPKTVCAMFIIDVDDFKQVNDRQGHLFGDAVLVELAAGMKKLTRKSDVIGRIGGDEFAVFLKDIPSIQVAEEKAVKLLNLFQHLFQGEKQPVEVTCSIGFSLYPWDGRDYQTLYHCADLALYQAKSQGKNQYARFDAKSMETVDRIGYSSLGAAIDSDKSADGKSGDLVNYVFQTLYDTHDIDCAVEAILEIVGRRFDVSRAYVFENAPGGAYTDNTYEWCNEGISPQKQFFQHFPYDAVKGYQELFRDHAVFYCRDIHTLSPAQAALFEMQGICSTLQCALYNGKEFCGFIGFDECTGLRMWNKEEIGLLSLVAQLLTTFLLKKREADRNQQIMVQLNTILDLQDAYIYAIRQDNYQLLYLNQKTLLLDPSAKIGDTCHRAFFGRDLPCETCPLSGATEVYNPQYDVWTRVRYSPMKWEECDAYLINCTDITEYKRLQESES
ncbi:diguanylate cyclase domain-containing protein [uncultured Oscillibacter sp.]|uniref:sensor domain-containing diguanylate cyclase n=1 Tax=uncultured Oscillibacter sp. TaxID=876091 RepID=UPI0025F66633|nr:diguanylate cyclase [uncultured Oscillibacter sp.]